MDLVSEMQASGVRIVTGTDAPNPYVIAGFSLLDELALLVKAGLTPMPALQAATRNPKEYLGKLTQQVRSSAARSQILIWLDANPLVDIKNTTRINAVIRNGRYLSGAISTKYLPMWERLQIRSDWN